MSELEDISTGVTKGFIEGLLTWPQRWRQRNAQKKHLRKMFGDGRFEYRSIDQLSKFIGGDQQLTRELLVEIGARPSESDHVLWTMKNLPKK